jgi:hypothetical protein
MLLQLHAGFLATFNRGVKVEPNSVDILKTLIMLMNAVAVGKFTK